MSDICRRRGRLLDPSVRGPVERLDGRWGIAPFYVLSERDSDRRPPASVEAYNFETETTYDNLYRLLRAMQLARPILLEGSPGVGKTTLIEAMSRAVGKEFVRINLSDQTDMMDLLGANLPSPEGDAGEFVWSDGPLLQAMKAGSWVLLDELNLAGQSILEGLNALLDHRGEIFVPELNTVVSCAPGFRLFGAQNPVQEGGGRKGLPKSFLNRFIRVRISSFSFQDLLNISRSIQPGLPERVVRSMTDCLWQCASRSSYRGQTGLDFNLRDLLRWCKLVQRKLDERLSVIASEEVGTATTAERRGGSMGSQSIDLTSEAIRWSRFYGNMLLAERMRSPEDRNWIEALLDERLLPAADTGCVDRFEVGASCLTIGNVSLSRKSWSESLRGFDSLSGSRSSTSTSSADCDPMIHASNHAILKSYLGVQETLAECVKNNWLSILVGPTGTGRSSSVAALAHLLGKRVVEIPMHPGIDISDLLGGFEQVDADRDSLGMLGVVKAFLRSLAVAVLGEGQTQSLSGLRDLWHGLQFDLNMNHSGGARDPASEGVEGAEGAGGALKQLAQMAIATLADNGDLLRELIDGLPVEHGKNLTRDLAALQQRGERFLARGVQAAGKFEWVDGTLTRCIQDGAWVILRDANLCNPSVLDRLNPLFEPGGFISLNECGSTDEGARSVVPHPEFRMFITYDPLGGEISRAMRNRGIEINMAVDSSTGLPSRRLGRGTSPCVSDVVAVMVANSIPSSIAQELAQQWLVNSNTCGVSIDRKSIHYLAKWARTINALVSSGLPLGRSVELSYRQCFNCDVSTEPLRSIESSMGPIDAQIGDPIADQLAAAVSAVVYPSLGDVAGGSRLDRPMADWGFIIELGKGFASSGSSSPSRSVEDWTVLMERHGVLATAGLAAFHWGGHSSDTGEDVMNAAMAICQGHVASSILVAGMMARILADDDGEGSTGGTRPARNCSEATAWKLCLSNGHLSVDSPHVRIALEGYRLARLAAAVPDSLSACANLLEASAWCHRNPFSQDHHQQHIKDASLLKWLWAALESIYAEMDSGSAVFSSVESCDALSLVRRVLMLQGVGADRERLAHAWQRLVDAIYPAAREDQSNFRGATRTVVEKVSRLLRGSIGDAAPDIAFAFIEAIGRPLVALNIELHDTMFRCHDFARQLRVNRDRLDAYRSQMSRETEGMEIEELDTENIDMREEEQTSVVELENILLLAMDQGLRSDVLEAMRIVQAGSLMDLDSLPRLRHIVDQLDNMMHPQTLMQKGTSNTDTRAAQTSLLRFAGALEQLGTLEELVVRRHEIEFGLRLSGVGNVGKGGLRSLSECLRDAGGLAEVAAKAIPELPSRTVSDALPFRALLDYHDIVISDEPTSFEDDASNKHLRVMRGLRMTALLQAHRDLWSAYVLISFLYLGVLRSGGVGVWVPVASRQSRKLNCAGPSKKLAVNNHDIHIYQVSCVGRPSLASPERAGVAPPVCRDAVIGPADERWQAALAEKPWCARVASRKVPVARVPSCWARWVHRLCHPGVASMPRGDARRGCVHRRCWFRPNCIGPTPQRGSRRPLTGLRLHYGRRC